MLELLTIQVVGANLCIIYPKHSQFNDSLEPFKFNESLMVNAVAYDLDSDKCDNSLFNERKN